MLNKLCKVFVCACAAGCCSLYINKHQQNALCELCNTWCCLFSTLIENFKLCFSAAAGIVLKFWAQRALCSYKIVLIKKCNNEQVSDVLSRILAELCLKMFSFCNKIAESLGLCSQTPINFWCVSSSDEVINIIFILYFKPPLRPKTFPRHCTMLR